MTEEKVKKYNLEGRLINFSITIIEVVEKLPDSRAASHVGGQILRSGTSTAFNYGEAQSAESRNDFIHKMKICLKELRETNIGLKIIKQKPFLRSEIIDPVLKECNELISIFKKSIQTSENNKIKNN
mgnify:CR=1 FL=1